jgi:DNA polymerase III sliding clamp (beta) subunit (PCNA family)
MPILESVIIRAENGVVSFYANNLNSDVTITSIDGNIIEEGVAAVHADGIKKLSNIKGYLTFETQNKLITVSNGKKKIQLACETNENEFVPPLTSITNADESIAVIKDFSELLSTLEILKATLSDSPSKPLYQCYHFDTRGYVESISGYHALRKSVDWFNDNTKEDFCINGDILKELKKIIDKKCNDRKINVYQNKGFIIFCGEDFRYSFKSTDGNWLDMDSFLNAEYKYSLKPDVDDFIEIVKEYKSYNTQKSTSPMRIITIDNDIVTFYQSNLVKTADKLCNDTNIPEGINVDIGFSPKYMYDVLSAFNKLNEKFTIYGNTVVNPWRFVGDTLSGIVVPMRVSENFTDIKTFAKELVA